MNVDKPQVKIGNENFKTWLKKLDPVSRVERMSDIAKSQAVNGLRGSLIKASLAQLSQRCVVKLTRLSDEQIKSLTRRKHLKKLKYTGVSSGEATIHIRAKSSKLSSKGNTVKKDENRSSKNVKVNSEEGLGKNNELSQHHIQRFSNKCTDQVARAREASFGFQTSSEQKLKRKLQELFNDDFDDIPDKNKSITEIEEYGKKSEKVKNYVSTTVNVNIYNSPINNENENNSTFITGKTHVENNILNINESSKKRLRIDVSLSNDESDFSNANARVFERYKTNDRKSTEKSHRDKPEKSLVHNSSKRPSEKNKKKLKSSRPKINKYCLPPAKSNVSSVDEDPSIKELWSIFGMESPTDRSESIIKSYPLVTAKETTILNNANLGKGSKLKHHPSLRAGGLSQQISDNSDSTLKITTEKSQLMKEGLAKLEDTTIKPLGDVPPKDVEPVCKIAETFSLAGADSALPNLFESSANQVDKNNHEKLPVFSDTPSNITHNMSTNNLKPCIIEILDNDEDEMDNSSTETTNSTQLCRTIAESNKVGTIRVKNLGLLLNPQIADLPSTSGNVCPILNENCLSTTNQFTENQSKDINQCVQETQLTPTGSNQPTVEERFFTTYKYYFDELVESKIPKLGELLHLAIADGIRRNERIKRAEQLSSDDLIKEEKQRAEKDFNDMMKIRGSEFSPLLEVILKRFDQSSKITLFIALFCRIWKHAYDVIDPANKNYILEARDVIRVMLFKHQFRDHTVSEFLQSDVEFKEQVKLVSYLTERATACSSSTLLQNKPQSNEQLTAINTTPIGLATPSNGTTTLLSNSQAHMQSSAFNNTLRSLTTPSNGTMHCPSNSQVHVQSAALNTTPRSLATQSNETSTFLSKSQVHVQSAALNTTPRSLATQSNGTMHFPSNSQVHVQSAALNTTPKSFATPNNGTTTFQSNSQVNVQSAALNTTPRSLATPSNGTTTLQRNSQIVVQSAALNTLPSSSATPSNGTSLEVNTAVKRYETTMKNTFTRILPKNTLPIEQNLQFPPMSQNSTSNQKSVQTRNISVVGTQYSNLQAKSIAPSTKNMLNNSISQTNSSLNSIPQQSSNNSLAIAFVAVPPRPTYTVQSLGTASSTRHQPNIEASRQLIKQLLTTQSVAQLTPTIVNTNSGTNPSLFSLNVYQQSLESTPIPQQSVVITPVSKPSNANSMANGQLGTTTNMIGSSDLSRTVVNKIGSELGYVNIPRKKTRPIIIRHKARSSPAILGLELSNIDGIRSNSHMQLTSGKTVNNNSNINTEMTTTVTSSIGANNPVVSAVAAPSKSPPADTSSYPSSTLAVQGQGPSIPLTSSHCHPFVKRMPYSGKMKMFFGNK